MTPPGNGQNRQLNPGAPFQNRMFGDTVGGEYGGAAHASYEAYTMLCVE